jgi:copper chaperone
MNMTIEVENIKCGGCANTITTKLSSLTDVRDVQVDIESGKVSLDGDTSKRDEYASALARMGYPEVGTVEGLKSAGAKAKSFVSCAVGRMSD